jgi:hypothetical protein
MQKPFDTWMLIRRIRVAASVSLGTVEGAGEVASAGAIVTGAEAAVGVAFELIGSSVHAITMIAAVIAVIATRTLMTRVSPSHALWFWDALL